MPSYLRAFYFNELVEIKKEENKQAEEATKRAKSQSKPRMNPRFKR
jgi:hypothetical protein|tara:strand:+ start:486 stop:623 length:138 start_codon:yes stop_codon:yes gene_type:complete